MKMNEPLIVVRKNASITDLLNEGEDLCSQLAIRYNNIISRVENDLNEINRRLSCKNMNLPER